MQRSESNPPGDNNQVNRHLQLEGLASEHAGALREALRRQRGVISVELVADGTSTRLDLVYNAASCQLEQIEKLVQAEGAYFSPRWWQRFKQGYYAFVDQNIKDNARHEPHCCSKIPPGAGK